MAENTNQFVVDASFVLAYLLPDEESASVDKVFRRYAAGEVNLSSSELLPFEVLNGLRTAVLQKRVDERIARKLEQAFLALEINLEPTDFGKCFALALKKNLTLYDASYLLLSQEKKTKLLTIDKNLQKFRS
ncbi:type II toxin-antitoxin system VapC family toxin [Candidatus Shapirobacteria bacterium]|nr:type II toxin-antitoxin system VapC family toxin [Candidatus Shapirobacteria bacterium]